MQVAPLVGKQRQSVQLANARINIWEGSVRSSKTISSLIKWLTFVREAPDGNLLMVGKTERTLKRNIIDPLTEMLGVKRCKLVIGSGELHLLGRLVYVAGANDERAQDKIRGLTLQGAYVDEATTVPESFWSMLLTRLSPDGARLFATTNPDSKNHWLKKKFLDRASVWLDREAQIRDGEGDVLDLARFSFQLADNPTLSATYVQSLAKEFVGLWYRRFVLGDWVAAEGAIYDMFDERRHVVDTVPRIDRWIGLGVDVGTVNPFHAVLLGLGVDGRLYVTNEWRYDSKVTHRSKTDAEYSEALRGWLGSIPWPGTPDLTGVRPQWTVVDPAAASFVAQLYRDGLTPTLADNAVLDGIRTVSSLLAAGQILIHSSCAGLLDEITGYVWDDKAALLGEDKPIKQDDHGLDALRYVIHTTEALWRSHIRQTT